MLIVTGCAGYAQVVAKGRIYELEVKYPRGLRISSMRTFPGSCLMKRQGVSLSSSIPQMN